MTDAEQNELKLTHTQRIIYEYFEKHPEDLAKLAEAIRPVTEAVEDIVVKISEALKPFVDALVPVIVAMVEEHLIDDEKDNEENSEDD